MEIRKGFQERVTFLSFLVYDTCFQELPSPCCPWNSHNGARDGAGQGFESILTLQEHDGLDTMLQQIGSLVMTLCSHIMIWPLRANVSFPSSDLEDSTRL